MTGCADCDEWVRELAARAGHPAEPAFRHCPTCGRDVIAYDIRPDDRQEADAMPEPKMYARDAAGRLGEIRGAPFPGSRRLFLRPLDDGPEWDVPADSITPCDRDGDPLFGEDPS